MQQEREISMLLKTGITAAFIALAFLGTLLVRLPIPATGGYFNLGDTFVMLAAMFFGPLTGLLTGLIGPTLADFIGFPQFVPATAVVKGLEGLIVGLVAYKYGNFSLKVIGLLLGIIIIAAGYFVFEAYIYPFIGQYVPFFAVTDIRAAFLELIPNIAQGLISAVISLAIWRLFKGKTGGRAN